jgi:hypothetical protein
MKFKKGNRVEYTEKGETKYGVVSRGGSGTITVILDGGEYQVKGHASLFQLSSHPLATDTEASPMDQYAVTGYREFRSFDGGGFNAFITKNKKKILEAYDAGEGGETQFMAIQKGSHVWESPESKQFHEDAKAWAIQFGDRTGTEAAAMWIEWHVHKRPYGVTAKMYWEAFNERISSFSS